jgi:hypothetical protein
MAVQTVMLIILYFGAQDSMGNKKKVQPVNYLHLINSIGGCLGAFFLQRASAKFGI